VLDELPLEARAYIIQPYNGMREIMYGVSPEFAMTKMDEVPQYECDLYVEDRRAEIMVIEMLAAHQSDLVSRCRVIPYGASSVGQALGQMVIGKRFPRPSCVFLDGDEGSAAGCVNLPGDDAPERVVFEGLRSREWPKLGERLGRSHSKVADACSRAMFVTDHHVWVEQAANALVVGGDTLWQALAAEWARQCLSAEQAKGVVQAIEDAFIGVWRTELESVKPLAAQRPAESATSNSPSPTTKKRVAVRPRRAATGKAYKALAKAFFRNDPARHTVPEVRKAVGLPDTWAALNQARNILVRLHNERAIQRVANGVYERAGGPAN